MVHFKYIQIQTTCNAAKVITLIFFQYSRLQLYLQVQLYEHFNFHFHLDLENSADTFIQSNLQ